MTLTLGKDLVGLEGLMLLMYDDPDGLHRLMAFLRDDHLAFDDVVIANQMRRLADEGAAVQDDGEGAARRRVVQTGILVDDLQDDRRADGF